MFRHGLLVLAATTLLNIGSFVFHAVVSRRLGVAAYGSLYALISLALLASFPAAIFNTVIAKFAAEFRALEDPAHLRALMLAVCKFFSVGIILYLAIGISLSFSIAQFLKVPAWSIVVVAGSAGCFIFVFALRALAQGTQDFRGFSISLVTDGALKASLGAGLAGAKFGLTGGVLGFFAGTMISGGYIGWRLWRRYGRKPQTHFFIDWQRVYLTTVGATALTVATTILSYGDVLIVKHFFAAHDAGIYAAASLAGKILFFMVGFAPMVLIPKAVDAQSRGKNPVAALGGAMLMVILISTMGLVGFLFWGNTILQLLVGGSFNEASALLPWYGLAMTLLAVTNVIASYSIALHRFAFGVPLVSTAIAEVATIFFYHPTLQRVVIILVIANAVALVVTTLFGGLLSLRRRS